MMEPAAMTERDLTALRSAVAALEHPSLAARLGNMIGKPIELVGAALPAAAAQAISAATSKALEVALHVALRTMQGARPSLSQRFHKLLATASGAAGGALGIASLPIELPVSTVIMLRSIAEIARSEGEDLSDPEAALACMQVFALGGRAGSDDVSESGYFAVRAMLAKSVSQAARFVLERGAMEEGAPLLVRFIAQIASRFGLVVTQKVAAQSHSDRRRAGRRCGQLCIHRTLPGGGGGALYGAPARARLRRRDRAQGVRKVCTVTLRRRLTCGRLPCGSRQVQAAPRSPRPCRIRTQ